MKKVLSSFAVILTGFLLAQDGGAARVTSKKLTSHPDINKHAPQNPAQPPQDTVVEYNVEQKQCLRCDLNAGYCTTEQENVDVETLWPHCHPGDQEKERSAVWHHWKCGMPQAYGPETQKVDIVTNDGSVDVSGSKFYVKLIVNCLAQ